MISAVLTPPPTPELALTSNGYPHLRRLRVTLTEHEFVITGSVPTYYHKQLAQEAVRGLIGRRRLINRVIVPDPTVVAVAG